MINGIFSVYKNKKILITGNTGFKGSWITVMLLKLGADVTGYALDPPTKPSIYDQLELSKKINQYIKDIRSLTDLRKCLLETQPDIIFHLAAQALVRESYQSPLETFDVNFMGTINLLEAVRTLKLSTRIVCITTDKCYENKEWLFGFREVDPLGGYDPYSASKGAMEIAISAYRRSFFNSKENLECDVKIASVRAGNVLGGGDWAKDRIVPDCIRSLQKNERIFVRNPIATRPWQHVLEPLSGYLLLGTKLFDKKALSSLYCDAFNFGPLISSNKTVEQLVEEILKRWGAGSWYHTLTESVHESSLLNLTIDKAYHLLKWQPLWNFEDTIKHTIEWYIQHANNANMFDFTDKQIDLYMNKFRLAN
ncbi:CDP-glucose 4,6-dehydratase [uncultured Draconibacterium sp.]|uniref:CDP-glucose 4,6-dehydratase n=1 Tax=uncultured Draconibacterium sp. TaxID=1573823 RepID=UPI0029C9AE34|nr:CDP-glucose 4,6-dehydratase [uncultured Draconibacterium sp.]